MLYLICRLMENFSLKAVNVILFRSSKFNYKCKRKFEDNRQVQRANIIIETEIKWQAL